MESKVERLATLPCNMWTNGSMFDKSMEVAVILSPELSPELSSSCLLSYLADASSSSSSSLTSMDLPLPPVRVRERSIEGLLPSCNPSREVDLLPGFSRCINSRLLRPSRLPETPEPSTANQIIRMWADDPSSLSQLWHQTSLSVEGIQAKVDVHPLPFSDKSPASPSSSKSSCTIRPPLRSPFPCLLPDLCVPEEDEAPSPPSVECLFPPLTLGSSDPGLSHSCQSTLLDHFEILQDMRKARSAPVTPQFDNRRVDRFLMKETTETLHQELRRRKLYGSFQEEATAGGKIAEDFCLGGQDVPSIADTIKNGCDFQESADTENSFFPDAENFGGILRRLSEFTCQSLPDASETVEEQVCGERAYNYCGEELYREMLGDGQQFEQEALGDLNKQLARKQGEETEVEVVEDVSRGIVLLESQGVDKEECRFSTSQPFSCANTSWVQQSDRWELSEEQSMQSTEVKRDVREMNFERFWLYHNEEQKGSTKDGQESLPGLEGDEVDGRNDNFVFCYDEVGLQEDEVLNQKLLEYDRGVQLNYGDYNFDEQNSFGFVGGEEKGSQHFNFGKNEDTSDPFNGRNEKPYDYDKCYERVFPSKDTERDDFGILNDYGEYKGRARYSCHRKQHRDVYDDGDQKFDYVEPKQQISVDSQNLKQQYKVDQQNHFIQYELQDFDGGELQESDYERQREYDDAAKDELHLYDNEINVDREDTDEKHDKQQEDFRKCEEPEYSFGNHEKRETLYTQYDCQGHQQQCLGQNMQKNTKLIYDENNMKGDEIEEQKVISQGSDAIWASHRAMTYTQADFPTESFHAKGRQMAALQNKESGHNFQRDKDSSALTPSPNRHLRSVWQDGENSFEPSMPSVTNSQLREDVTPSLSSSDSVDPAYQFSIEDLLSVSQTDLSSSLLFDLNARNIHATVASQVDSEPVPDPPETINRNQCFYSPPSEKLFNSASSSLLKVPHAKSWSEAPPGPLSPSSLVTLSPVSLNKRNLSTDRQKCFFPLQSFEATEPSKDMCCFLPNSTGTFLNSPKTEDLPTALSSAEMGMNEILDKRTHAIMKSTTSENSKPGTLSLNDSVHLRLENGGTNVPLLTLPQTCSSLWNEDAFEDHHQQAMFFQLLHEMNHGLRNTLEKYEFGMSSCRSDSENSC